MSDSAKNYCALVADGVVSEVIVSDYQWVVANLDGEWRDLGGEPLTVAIGWTYDADTNTFSPPPPADLDEFITPSIEAE
jgi:hypothetical protein